MFIFWQGQDFSLLHSVQTGLGAHIVSYPVGAGCKADYSPQFSAAIKNDGAIPPLPHMASWHSA
jgi:hypothetical protein